MRSQQSNRAILPAIKSMSLTEEHRRDSDGCWCGKLLKAGGLICSRIIRTEPASAASDRTPRCDWPRCLKASKTSLNRSTLFPLWTPVPHHPLWLYIKLIHGECAARRHTSGAPLWLHYPRLYVPVTCHDIKNWPHSFGICWWYDMSCLQRPPQIASGKIIKWQ